MLPEEVAELFGMSERTVKAWARNAPQAIGAIQTPGGQWRFRAAQVRRRFEAQEEARQHDPGTR